MNCDRFSGAITDLARCQMMDASLREDALRHCQHCAECAMRLQAEQQLSERLLGLARDMRTISVSSDLEGKLLAEFRVHKAEPRRSSVGRWIYGAVAASVFLAVGLVAAQLYRDSAPAVVTVTAPKPAPAQEKVSSEAHQSSPVTEPDDPMPVLRQRRKSSRPRIQVAETNPVPVESLSAANLDPEVTTDFLLVGDANSLSTLDGGQMVRVELPRSAMARFGLPVNVERYNERVKADVIMGSDGLARAIRFVQ